MRNVIQKMITNFFRTGHERTVNAKKNIFISFGIKGVSIAVSLMLIPMTISYVDASQYGIWLTLSSIVAWFTFFDIGFSQGLRNRFSEAKSTGEFNQAAKYVSTTYAVLSIVFSVFWLLFFLINHFLNWSSILNAPQEMASELSKLALIVVTFFSLQIVLKTINTIVIADQKPALSNFFDMLGQLISLVCVYLLTLTTKGSLISLGVSLGLSPLLILVLSSIYLFRGKYKQYKPTYKNIDFSYAKDIMKLGVKYFIINISIIVIYQSNNLIIAHIGSPKDVTIFNIAYKYLSVVFMVFMIVMAPFWSAFTEAYTKREVIWMQITVKRLRLIGYIFIFFLVILVSFSEFAYNLWIGELVTVPFSVTVVIAVYMTALILTSLNTQILNGIGAVRLQLIIYSFAMVFHIPLALFLGGKYGMEGVIFSASFFYLIIAIFSIIQLNKILVQKAQGIWIE